MDRVNAADMFVDVQATVLPPQRQDGLFGGGNLRRRQEQSGRLRSSRSRLIR